MTTTLQVYRRALQVALDDVGAYLVASATTSAIAVSGISDSTASASANRYDGRWLYVASGALIGTQRRVAPGGFAPSTGTLTLAYATPSALLADVLVELTGLFPCETTVPSEDTSYNTLIRRALSRLWAPDEVTVAFAGTTEASLSAYAYWLDRPERLMQVLEPAPVSGYQPVPCDWRHPELVFVAGVPSLQLNRPYTGTLTLQVKRPGDSLVSGAESTTGPLTESSTCLPSVNDVVAVALEEAYRVLTNRTPGRPNGSWADKLEAQMKIVDGLAYLDRSQMAQRAPTQPEAA